MIRKDIRKFKYGTRTEIRVVEGYRDQFGKVKQKTIKKQSELKLKNQQISYFMKIPVVLNIIMVIDF